MESFLGYNNPTYLLPFSRLIDFYFTYTCVLSPGKNGRTQVFKAEKIKI